MTRVAQHVAAGRAIPAARQRVSRHGAAALIAMLAPGVLFPIGLFLLRNRPGFSWVRDPMQFPWELWVIAFTGIVASVGGILDWRHHRSGHTAVGKKEHASHVAALGLGGGTMFLLMCAASLMRRRREVLLLPIIVVALFTAALICYDEFVFHRGRCGRFETLTHRLLVFGNTTAWLAWVHWCFVRGGGGEI
jgi:hypothetical protein